MTMRRFLATNHLICQLLTYTLLYLLPVAHGEHTSTTTTTLLSTTTVLTSTITFTTRGRTIETTTTQTTATELAPSETMSWGSGNGNYSTQALKAQTLNSTNYFRRHYEAKPVTWDPQLARYAQHYAEKCIWEHSGGPHGENLAKGYASPTLAIDAWAAEESDYSYSDAGFGESTGHFTQLVWRNTTRVGCGATDCGDGDGWMLVCEYEPPGNVEGAFSANVRKAGMGEDGKPGLGGAGGRRGGVAPVLVALVVVGAVVTGLM